MLSFFTESEEEEEDGGLSLIHMMLQRRLRERAMQDLEIDTMPRDAAVSVPAVPAAPNDEGFAEEENETVATSADSENGSVRKMSVSNGKNSDLADIPEVRTPQECQSDSDSHISPNASPAGVSVCSPDGFDITKNGSPSTDGSDVMCDTPPVTSSMARAIPIATTGETGSGRDRYISGTSISTSYTSGIGTCSSVEDHDHSDLDFNNHGSCELETHKEEEDSMNRFATNGKSMATDSAFEKLPTDNEDDDLGSPIIKRRSGRKQRTKELLFGDTDKARNATDKDTCESTNDISEEMPLTCDSAANKGEEERDATESMDCDVNDVSNEEPTITMREVLIDSVRQLPVPPALQQFLLFYRE